MAAKSGVRLLADECLSIALPDILNRVGIRGIHSFRSEFEYGIPDEDWVPEATRRNFICLSCDRKMLIREQIAAFISRKTARMIFLPSSVARARLRVQLGWMLRYWDRIEHYADAMPPGAIASINKRGQISAMHV